MLKYLENHQFLIGNATANRYKSKNFSRKKRCSFKKLPVSAISKFIKLTPITSITSNLHLNTFETEF